MNPPNNVFFVIPQLSDSESEDNEWSETIKQSQIINQPLIKNTPDVKIEKKNNKMQIFDADLQHQELLFKESKKKQMINLKEKLLKELMDNLPQKYEIQKILKGEYDNQKIAEITVIVLELDVIGDTVSAILSVKIQWQKYVKQDQFGEVQGSLVKDIFDDDDENQGEKGLMANGQKQIKLQKKGEKIKMKTPFGMYLKDVTVFQLSEDQRIVFINESNILSIATFDY